MENELITKIRGTNKKIIVAGNGGVGRTTILHRYTENYFKKNTMMTIGIQIFTSCIKINDKNINFVFWDLAGQQRWRFFQSDFCKGADGAILAFDLTRPMSLDNIGEWVNILRSRNKDLPIILLGMKLDLIDEIILEDDHYSAVVDKFNITDFHKVSCKTGENVQKAFQSLFSHVLKIPRETIPVIKYIDERTKKIERMLQVSNRIKLEMMRTALNMDKKAFYEKIFEWAGEFSFTIDDDILIVDKDIVSDYITKLDMMFKTWEKSGTEKLSKI
jgi:small GTP-binding protein